MHGYYIAAETRNTANIGKKINMQMEEFNRHFQTEFIELRTKELTVWEKIKIRLPFCSVPRNYDTILNKMESPDFVYIRRCHADRGYIAFFKEIKRRFPQCKVIVEIYTYPYDRDDFCRFKTWMFYGKEVYNRKKLKLYVDRFVTYSNDDKIFGVLTIKTGNGVCVENVKAIKPDETDKTIDIIAVAMYQRHHGYERLIQGLGEYYKNGGERDILLHMVGGDGSSKKELSKYKEMVQKHRLDKHVVFYGVLTGDALDAVYNKADIGVGSLGMYKIGLDEGNTLKSREYAARGLPYIIAGNAEGKSEEEKRYFHYCPNNASAIDVDEIISFYDRIYTKESRTTVIEQIRENAKNTIDNTVVMKPIVDYVLNGK